MLAILVVRITCPTAMSFRLWIGVQGKTAYWQVHSLKTVTWVNGLAPSPFSSPSQPDDDDENGHYYRSLYLPHSPIPRHRYHDLDQLERLGLYHNRRRQQRFPSICNIFVISNVVLASSIVSDLPHNQLSNLKLDPQPALVSFDIAASGIQSPFCHRHRCRHHFNGFSSTMASYELTWLQRIIFLTLLSHINNPWAIIAQFAHLGSKYLISVNF